MEQNTEWTKKYYSENGTGKSRRTQKSMVARITGTRHTRLERTNG